MRTKELLHIFFPLLMSFLANRLLTQTDIIMLSNLGTEAVAAFSIPSRIMIIDIIAAMSIIPVLSVTISKNKKELQKPIIEKCFSLCITISTFLCFLGLIAYPYLLQFMNVPPNTQAYALEGLFWLTLAIPFRFLKSTGNIVLHSLGKGNEVVFIAMAEVVANFIINYILIFVLNMGFEGAFISTFLVSGLAMLFILFRVNILTDVSYTPKIDITWSKKFLRGASAEWIRLFSERLVLLVLIAFFMANGVEVLASYSVVSEWENLLFLPLIAFMRAIGIFYPKHYKAAEVSLFFNDYRSLFVVISFCLLLLGLGFALFSENIGISIYSLESKSLAWWAAYMLIFPLYLPVRFLSTLIMGVGFATENYKNVSKIDVILSWVILLPVVYIGTYYDNSLLTWSGFLLTEVLFLVFLIYQLKNKSLVAK